MFVKFTKLDGNPIWINASFVVTVEPRKDGGAVVVPVGDGLDYDVRESPEKVLSILGDAPAPAVVPIPSTDALKKAPVAAEPGPDNVTQLVNEAKQEPAAKEAPLDVFAAEPAEKPAKKPRKTAAAKTTAAKEPAAKKPRATRKKKPALPIAEDQVERLKKMMPKSVQKLQNTLVSQFRVENAADAVQALAANGVFALEGDRVIWQGTV